MKKNQIIGIVLMALSFVFFAIFLWWATTEYQKDFAIGIFVVMAGSFIGGLITYHIDG